MEPEEAMPGSHTTIFSPPAAIGAMSSRPNLFRSAARDQEKLQLKRPDHLVRRWSTPAERISASLAAVRKCGAANSWLDRAARGSSYLPKGWLSRTSGLNVDV